MENFHRQDLGRLLTRILLCDSITSERSAGKRWKGFLPIRLPEMHKSMIFIKTEEGKNGYSRQDKRCGAASFFG